VGDVVVLVGVPVGIGVVVGVDVPDGTVGTTTPPSTWANATELPRKQDKPKLLKKTNFNAGDDINHPQ